MIEEMQGEIVASVCESVRIESTEGAPEEGMPFGKGPAKALRHALQLAEQLGFRTENIDNRIGYAECGAGEEMIAALGHLDVVDAGKGWSFPPFSGDVCDGTIRGRGTLDNKGPIIGALYAMKAVEASGLPLSRRIRIIFGTNEETGSRDIASYKETQEAPVMAFTPDASYPAIFAEKGILTFSLTKKIYPHDGTVKLLSLEGGTASNVVPDTAKASVLLPDGTVKELACSGVAAHGSTPERGKNAIVALLAQLSGLAFCADLKRWFAVMGETIGGETDGRTLGIAIEDDKFGNLTVNLATMRADVDQISAQIDIRYPITKRAQDIWQAVAETAVRAGAEASVVRYKEPLYVPEDSELIQKLQAVYHNRTGQKSSPLAIGGGTYAKAMPNTVAFGPLFSGQEDVMHQPDESISVQNLLANVKIMASALYELAR